MIKRNSRNLNKIVRVRYPEVNNFNGKEGIVVGFRGDHDKNDPYVNVFLFCTGSVWPIPGKYLIWTGERRKL